MSPAKSNRRRADRFSFRRQSQWNAGTLRDRGMVEDISEEGPSLRTRLPPGLTRPGPVFVPLPERGTGSTRLHMLSGIVVWRTRGRCGVAFSEVARKTAMALKQLPAMAPVPA